MPAEKFHENESRLVPEKNSIGKNADALAPGLAFKEINRSLLKVDKNQKIGNRTFGNCYIALYRNECRVVAKEMKIIEPSKKAREEGEKHRQSLELETTGESLSYLVFAQIGHHFRAIMLSLTDRKTSP